MHGQWHVVGEAVESTRERQLTHDTAFGLNGYCQDLQMLYPYVCTYIRMYLCGNRLAMAYVLHPTGLRCLLCCMGAYV